MKKILSIIMLLFTSTLFAQHDVVTKSLEVEEGYSLEVEVNPGDIQINTWNKNEVLVKVDGLDKDEQEYLSIYKRGEKVIVKYESKWGWSTSSNYYITIPSKMNVKLYTTGGDVEINNDVAGDVQVNTMGGDIAVQNIAGNARIETMGGDISFKNISGNASITTQGGVIKGMDISGVASEIKTMGGDIQLGKINDVRKVTTFGGDIYVKETQGDVELTTFGGDITLDKGQKSVKAQSYGGDIIIGMANGTIDVNTGAGDIILKKISGNVSAKTSAGDIEIELNPDNRESDIKTNAGSITLYLPSSAKVDVYAKAISSGWNTNAANVVKSDFVGSVNDKRGDVTGKYSLNGGGAKIYLKTVSGTINIKKKN